MSISKCYYCLCEVCTRHKCPHLFSRKHRVNICLRSKEWGSCPRTKCDFFVNGQRHKVYKVVRKRKKADIQIEMLKEILGVLKSDYE